MKEKSGSFFKGAGTFLGAALFFVLYRYLNCNIFLAILAGAVVATIIMFAFEKKNKEDEEN